jgi:hypothetical protein
MNSGWEMDDKYNSVVEYEEKGDDANEYVFDDDSNDFNIADDSLLEGTWEGESVDINNDDEGKEIHEEYLDDEINNHEVGGEFDSDMNYNNDDEDSGEDEQLDEENYLEEGEEEIDYENEENDLVENQDDEVEKEQGEDLDGEDVALRALDVSYFNAITENRIASLPTHLPSTSSTLTTWSGLCFL